MNKDDITFAVVGIILGLFLGFFAGNWSQSSAPTASTNTPTASTPATGGSGNLPANHPTVDPDKPVQARPLTPDQIEASKNSPDADAAHAGAADGIAALPSIDPLPASSKEERAEQKYKNIQVLKGIPAASLMKVMFAFKESLGVDCTFCHIQDQFEKDDKQNKKTARAMINMMRDTNERVTKAIGEEGRVTCFTCHRGQQKPAS